MPGITEGSSGDQGRGADGVQERSGNATNNGDEIGDGTEGSRGESQPRSFVYPAVPPPFESGTAPVRQDWEEEAGDRGRHLPEAPPPAAAVRVRVWDTATATPSNSDNPSVGTSIQSNHFNMALSGYAGSTTVNSTAAAQNQGQPPPQRETGSPSSPSRHGDGGQELSSGDPPATPSKYESLLEKPETSGFPTAAAGVISGGGGAPGDGLYPKLVNRNGLSGRFSDGGGGGNGLQGEGTVVKVGETSAQRSGTTSTDWLDGALANAAEKSVSLEDNGPRRMDGGGGK